MHDLSKLSFSSKAIHAGYVNNENGSLVSPIYQSSTFVFDSAEQGGKRFALEEPGYIYSRISNPSTAVIEEKLVALEDGAEAAVATASGIGAISSTLWTALKAGDHVVASDTLYGCTYALLSHGLTRFGIEVSFVDITDLEAVKAALKPNTAVVYLETPANPTLKITDIKSVSEMAHANKADCKVIVDNTFSTPYLQTPLTLGADVVVYSATKYLNGHGDVIAGFVVGKADFMLQVRVVGVKDMTGAVLSPFDAFLLERGMKTLDVRMERHCDNAMKVAQYLETHPKISKVFYPGLASFEQHDLAKAQYKNNNFGGMIAFILAGNDDDALESGKKVLNNVQLCRLAVSLGDTESLIQHPASMTHSPYTKEERANSGIAEGLVRLSVGLENAEDIIADMEHALTFAK